MNYIIKGHNYKDEVLSILQMFYINTSFVLADDINDNGITVSSIIDNKYCYSIVYENKNEISKVSLDILDFDVKELKRYIKLSLFKALKNINNVETPWGILTGIRPAKRVVDMLKSNYTKNQIKDVLKNKYFVSDNKINLLFDVASTEMKILSDEDYKKTSLYIGIPFCPTRCLYCSFTSYSLEQYKDKVDLYLSSLKREIEFISSYVKEYQLESIYIGGGTPTSLNEAQLEFLLEIVQGNFNVPCEFTVEAGRPDTITKEKLKLLKRYNVSRISINPQTMNQATLDIIGRKHTINDFINSFYMARKEGHNDINVDIILGLPSESVQDVENTLNQILKLSPESMTVHTLAVKRASRLKETIENYSMIDFEVMEKMISLSSEYAKKMNMNPYYLYRQKNMVGNFENVGYCKQGYECIYNIKIMEEKQNIFAVGAGASTKTVDYNTNKIERIFNVKSVDDYINRIDEMIQRKKGGLK